VAKGSKNTKKVWVKKRMRISGMVPPKNENPKDGESNRSGSGAKVHLGLTKNDFKEKASKKRK